MFFHRTGMETWFGVLWIHEFLTSLKCQILRHILYMGKASVQHHGMLLDASSMRMHRLWWRDNHCTYVCLDCRVSWHGCPSPSSGPPRHKPCIVELCVVSVDDSLAVGCCNNASHRPHNRTLPTPTASQFRHHHHQHPLCPQDAITSGPAPTPKTGPNINAV